MTSFTLQIRNFRIHESVNWGPEGVCILCGANGTGKSTILDSLTFLRGLFLWGHESALDAVDGVSFGRIGVADPVEFTVSVGNLLWRVRFPMSASGVKGNYGEELLRDGEVILRAPMFQDTWFLQSEELPRDSQRCAAKVLWDRGNQDWMEPLAEVLSSIRVYSSYWLNQVKSAGPVGASDSYLHGTGRNLWSVLSNWKNSPIRYSDQFNWVMNYAHKAFPGVVGTIEFDRGLAFLFWS